MSDAVLVAIIAATVSMLTLAWNFFIIRKSRAILLKVEDGAKRSEIVRSQGLKAIDQTLSALTGMLFGVGNLSFLKEHGVGLHAESEDFLAIAKSIGDSRTELRKIRIISSPYLHADLAAEMDMIWESTKHLNQIDIENTELEIMTCIENIATHAKIKYLN